MQGGTVRWPVSGLLFTFSPEGLGISKATQQALDKASGWSVPACPASDPVVPLALTDDHVVWEEAAGRSGQTVGGGVTHLTTSSTQGLGLLAGGLLPEAPVVRPPHSLLPAAPPANTSTWAAESSRSSCWPA